MRFSASLQPVHRAGNKVVQDPDIRTLDCVSERIPCSQSAPFAAGVESGAQPVSLFTIMQTIQVLNRCLTLEIKHD
jgi:hypothetical protein